MQSLSHYAGFLRSRRTFISAVSIAWLFVGLTAWPSLVEAGATTLRIGGTGGALGGMRLLADAFAQQHPDVDIQVLPSLGSGGGIKAFGAGVIDMALSSRPRKQKERARHDDHVVEIEFARTPFVFVTSPEIDLDELTSAEVATLYHGESTAWPQGQPRRLVMRPLNESDTRILRDISEDMDRAIAFASARRGMLVAVNDQENADMLETSRGGFGAMTLGQLLTERRRLKPIALDGVIPTPETLSAGSYPLFKRFYLIADPKKSPIVADLVAFMQSTTAAEILAASGHLPMMSN